MLIADVFSLDQHVAKPYVIIFSVGDKQSDNIFFRELSER
jgi:hypothetical protein